jgi:hypothetical protein
MRRKGLIVLVAFSILAAVSAAATLGAEKARLTIFDIPLGAIASELPSPTEFG